MKSLLEKALNHYLAFDPASKQRIAMLENKVVTIELKGVGFNFQLHFLDGHIALRWQDFAKPDLVIKGTPLNLVHMSIAKTRRQQFFAEDVIVEGNMELAQHVLAIFDDLSIDWEDVTARVLGDIPAHHLGRLVKGMQNVGAQLRRSFAQNVNEYVHEEIHLAPPAEALQDFFQHVDELRMNVDRLEARVLRLSKLRGVS